MLEKKKFKSTKTDVKNSPIFSPAKEFSKKKKNIEKKSNESSNLNNELNLIENDSEINTDEKSALNKNQTEVNKSEYGLGLSQEIVDEKMKEALETQSPKKRKKSTIINACLLIFNLIFMFFIVKNLISSVGEDGSSLSSVIKMQGDRLWWLAGGVLAYIFYMFVQTIMYKVIIRDFTGRNRWWLSYDVAITGKYYDNVTPFAVGGQPMQIVKLAQNDISAGVSTSIPII